MHAVDPAHWTNTQQNAIQSQEQTLSLQLQIEGSQQSPRLIWNLYISVL